MKTLRALLRISLLLLALMSNIATARAEAFPPVTVPLALRPSEILPLIFPDGSALFYGQTPIRSAKAVLVATNGDVVWQFESPNSRERFGYFSVAPLPDGRLVLYSHANNSPPKQELYFEDYVLDGVEVQTKEYRTAKNGSGWLLPVEGGYLIYGIDRVKADKHGGKFYVPFLELRDAQGEKAWRRAYPKYEMAMFGAFRMTDGYLLYGELEQQNKDRDFAFAVCKLSQAGKMLWIKTLPRAYGHIIDDGLLMPGGGLLLISHTISENPNRRVLHLFGEKGELLWEKELLFDAGGTCFTAIAVPGGVLLTGRDNARVAELEFLLLDEAGELQRKWGLTLEGIQRPIHANLRATPEGVYLAAYGESEAGSLRSDRAHLRYVPYEEIFADM